MNLFKGGIEITNNNPYDIKVTHVVDHDNTECVIAINGEPSPVIIRAGKNMVIITTEPGVSMRFEPLIIKTDRETMRNIYGKAHEEIDLANCL